MTWFYLFVIVFLHNGKEQLLPQFALPEVFTSLEECHKAAYDDLLQAWKDDDVAKIAFTCAEVDSDAIPYKVDPEAPFEGDRKS